MPTGRRWNYGGYRGGKRKPNTVSNSSIAEEDEDVFQTPSEGSLLFNFGSDPRVRMARDEILKHRKKEPVQETAEWNLKESQSKTSNKTACKGRKKLEIPPDAVGFRTASGRPVERSTLISERSISNKDKREYASDNENLLGISRPIVTSSFLPPRPLHNVASNQDESLTLHHSPQDSKSNNWKKHPSLKRFDANIVDLIEAEIMSKQSDTEWADVAGLEFVKKSLKEIIILPFLRPDIFTGIRAPPKGILLFGPPGTGKTLIGRCVASQCKATFFNISASSITSKWVGEGEKLVRVLFVIARILQPSIIFIDEIDSLLTTRKESEHEASRRIKTEFLVNLDGVDTLADERILVLGATNRPQELDDAAKRRFAKRLYIGLPCSEARSKIIYSLYKGQKHTLSDEDVNKITTITEGYSGADMKQLCCEAALGPIRDIVESSTLDIATIKTEEVRPISLFDFENAFAVVRPTVLEKDLIAYKEWNQQYGSA